MLDCNKANKLIMDYMDFNISKEDEFLLQNHLKECPQCREDFELYTQILEEFTLDTQNTVEAPENFELNVMKKIENIEPTYIREKNNKNIVAYAILTVTALMFSMFFIIYLNKDAFLNIEEQMPVLYNYYLFFENLSNFSLETFSLSNLWEQIYILMPSAVEGIKYTSVIAIIFIIVAQYFLTRRESLKI